jgi:RNA polymerase sigma-70 factor (ECF subfamily)
VIATSDEALLGRYRDERRPEDFAELYARYAGDLGGYLVRYVGDPVLAEDVLQDTFLQVHAKSRLYGDGWPVRPWLYAIASHRAVDAMRRARRYPAVSLDQPIAEDEDIAPGNLLQQLASDEPGPLGAMQGQERQDWVRESVAQLPHPMRQTLILAYYQDLTYAEIAGLQRVPLGTVKSRLHGALARLRAMAERHKDAGSL